MMNYLNYGDWINNPDYGYVWRPNVGRDFKPYYSNGHWAMTEYGNTWVSGYDWGWAPFHYGRWFYDDYDGWIWTPDTEWGPAWVSWRTGDGYYGWAPLAPRININIGRRYNVPNNYWVFIPQRCIYYPSYGRYWEPKRNVYIINNTTIINNIYTNKNVRYYTGPGVDDVRRATRQNVPVYRIADDSRPGSTRISKDAVNIYRPDVSRDDKNSAPRSIANNTGRPSRSSDNNSGRSGDNTSDRNGSVNQSQRSQRPDAIENDRNSRSDNQPSNRGAVDSRSQRPDASEIDRNSRSDNQPSNRGTVDSRSQRTGSSNGQSTPSRSERPTESRSDQNRSSSPAQQQQSNSSRPDRAERSQPTPRSTESTKKESDNSSRGQSSNSSRPTRTGN
jgi:hypothetical protein